jgi:hypothetical protein
VLRYPPAGDEDFFMSGEADGEAALGGTAAVIDERVGAGRIVSFGFEPNFRAFTDGTQRIVHNAMFGADPDVAATARVTARRRAALAARRLRVVREPLRIVVRPRGSRLVRRLLSRRDARYTVHRSRGRVAFVVANPGDRTGDEHPYARQLGRALQSRHASVVLFRAP